MNSKIEQVKNIRKFLLSIINDLNADQLNEVPAGFNNNIIWNVAHLVAAQQGICYIRSGIKLTVEEKYFQEYKPGTKPERSIDGNEIETIKQLLTTTLDQFELDYKNNLFVNYNVFTTRYGVELKNIDEAIDFLPFHEGFHSGYIIALKRLVK
jgi:DinB superfamily